MCVGLSGRGHTVSLDIVVEFHSPKGPGNMQSSPDHIQYPGQCRARRNSGDSDSVDYSID